MRYNNAFLSDAYSVRRQQVLSNLWFPPRVRCSFFRCTVSIRDGKEAESSKNEPDQHPGFAKNRTEPEPKSKKYPSPNLNHIEPYPVKNRIEPKPICPVLAPFFRTLSLQNSNLIFWQYSESEQSPEHLSSKTQTEHEPISSFYFYSQIVFYSSLFLSDIRLRNFKPPTEHSWIYG